MFLWRKHFYLTLGGSSVGRSPLTQQLNFIDTTMLAMLLGSAALRSENKLETYMLHGIARYTCLGSLDMMPPYGERGFAPNAHVSFIGETGSIPSPLHYFHTAAVDLLPGQMYLWSSTVSYRTVSNYLWCWISYRLFIYNPYHYNISTTVCYFLIYSSATWHYQRGTQHRAIEISVFGTERHLPSIPCSIPVVFRNTRGSNIEIVSTRFL